MLVKELQAGMVLENPSYPRADWRRITVLSACADPVTPCPYEVWTVVYANDAGVRSCRMFRNPENEVAESMGGWS